MGENKSSALTCQVVYIFVRVGGVSCKHLVGCGALWLNFNPTKLPLTTFLSLLKEMIGISPVCSKKMSREIHVQLPDKF